MGIASIQEKQSQSIVDKLALANGNVHWNLSPAQLIEKAIKAGEGKLCENGAFAADTGKFTGRSQKDKFIVCDELTEKSVWWGDINIKFDPDKFDSLYEKVINHLLGKEIYV